MEVTPLTPEEIILLAESSDGKGTKSQNNWAANRWKTWAAARNEQFKAGGIRMLEDLKKVPEIKDTEGLPYEGKTFHTLVMAANRVCVAAHGEEGQFYGKAGRVFIPEKDNQWAHEGVTEQQEKESQQEICYCHPSTRERSLEISF